MNIVDQNDLKVITDLLSQEKVAEIQMENLQLKVELAKLKLAKKYNLSDADTIDSNTGQITRK